MTRTLDLGCYRDPMRPPPPPAPLPPPRRVGLVEADPGGPRFRDAYAPEAAPLPLRGDAPAGAWVEVELRQGVAHQERLAALPGSPGAVIHALAARHGVDPMHPPACEAETTAWLEHPGLDDPALEDLTGLAFVTIDGPSSKDLDQAVLVEAAGDEFVVWYALADASYYVRPGMALFEEALRRGATFYMPGLVAPMLPRRLSEGLVSLNPEVERRATVLRMEVDAAGKCRTTEVRRARIRSRAKLSFPGVQAWLDGGPPPVEDAAVLASLRALAALGERRLREAETRDVVRFRRLEVEVELESDGPAGLAFMAQASARDDVERYNEQVSLLANIEGARLLRAALGDPRVHPVFRTHEPPQAELLQGFARQVAALIASHGLDEATWAWRPEGPESLAAYVRRLPLEDAAQAGVARAVQRQALRTSGRSGYGAQPGRHFGVGAAVYSRLTAPMREVVGIFVHKELWELMGGQEPRPDAEDQRSRDQVLTATRQARSLQRRLDQEGVRLVLDQLFSRDLGRDPSPWHLATVMGLGRRKVHVTLDGPPVDVKVYAGDLEAAYGVGLRVDADAADVTDDEGRVRLRVGQRARLRVLGLDPDRDRWRLEVRGLE